MKNKTVIVILSIALLLFAYILVVDKSLQTTQEKKSRSEHVFSELRVEQISKIELHTKRGDIAIAATIPDPGEEKLWRIISPVSLAADQTEIEAIISALDFLIFERAVEQNPDSPQFGFARPQIKGTIYTGSKTTQFQIGANAPGTNSVYMSVGHDKKRIYVVSSDFFTSMNKTQNDLRNKRFIQQGQLEQPGQPERFELQDILNVNIRNQNEIIDFSRDELSGDWFLLHHGEPVLAATSVVRQLIQRTRELDVQKFVTDDTQHLEKFGLATPRASVTLKTSANKSVSLLVGNDCKNDLVYATVQKSLSVRHPVHCISKTFLQNLMNPKKRFFEKRLLPIASEHIARLELHKNERQLVLSKNATQQWEVSGLPIEETSQVELSTFFETLKQVHAKEIHWRTNDQTAIPLSTISLASMRIDTTDERSQTITIYSSTTNPQNVLFQRDDSVALLEIPKDVLALIEPFPLRFRKKVLENAHKEDITAVDITSAQGTQSLKNIDGKWLITKPEAAATDSGKVKKLLQLIAQTPIQNYVLPPSDPSGPDPQFASITAAIVAHDLGNDHDDLTHTKNITIDIGGPFDTESRYARISSNKEMVFTINNSFASFLNRPLAARNLLTINSGIINKVDVRGTSKPFTAIKHNESWSSDQCDIDEDVLERIIIDFGAVKAIRTHQFGTNIGKEVATVSFVSDESNIPAVLHFGTTIPDVDGVLCRREGLDVTFVLPYRILKELTAVCP